MTEYDRFKMLFCMRFRYNTNTGLMYYKFRVYQLTKGLSFEDLIHEIAHSKMELIV